MLPIGLKEDNNVCTTSFNPGALFITRSGLRDRRSLKTLKIPNILGLDSLINDISKSTIEIITNEPSIIFHPDVKYASGP